MFDTIKKELDDLKNNNPEMYDEILFDNQTRSFRLIQNNCIKNKCPNYASTIYDGHSFHMCNDNWSFAKNGWHPIYCETIDLCVEHKKVIVK